MGTLTSGQNMIITFYHQICKQWWNIWSTYVEWKKQESLHQIDSGHCIEYNTDSPINIYKFIPPEVWEAFNIGINAWNITAALYSIRDRTNWLSPFPGDFSTYSLRYIRCGQHVTYAGLMGETLSHAPTAPLYHWNMIKSHDKQKHSESMLMPLLFTSYDNYLWSSIFSRRYVLYGWSKNLPRTNQIWTGCVLWGC